MSAVLATQPSNLLPLLFERLPAGRPLVVLDVGSGSSDTVAFCASLGCRLYFADLFDEKIVREPQSDATEAELTAQFEAALDFAGIACFDVCLFWDFLNHLDGPALRAFVAAIRPRVHFGTRSHGFGTPNAKVALNNNQFGIRRRDLVSYRRRSEAQLPVYPHSQRELTLLLGYFTVNKSRMLGDGQIEYILDCDGLNEARAPRKSVYNF